MSCTVIQKTRDFTVAFWRITESEEELNKLVSESDLIAARKYVNPGRRLENLAWRAALRSITPDLEVEYAENGAPIVGTDGLFISVSHSSGAAVVVLSCHPCGVDIERTDRDLINVQKRFISEKERIIMDNSNLKPVHFWTAKEALYKYNRKNGIDFLRDIRVESVDVDSNLIFASISGQNIVPVRLTEEGEYTIAYIH